MKIISKALFGFAMLGFAAQGQAAAGCAEAARALVDGANASVGHTAQRSSAASEINWTTGEGHEGVCRYDSQGRLQSVAITRFPAAHASPYQLQCASYNYRRHECAMRGSAENVRLQQQLSRSECIFNRTWGHYGNVLWVDKGCNGRFTVTPAAAWEPYALKCESTRNRRQNCAIKAPADVTMARKLSKASCTLGSSWGYEGETLWVDRGCRAEFSVRPFSTGGDAGHMDIRGRATDACVAMARTHGFGVSEHRILDVDRAHAVLEMAAHRQGISLNLICRYEAASGQARLYGD